MATWNTHFSITQENRFHTWIAVQNSSRSIAEHKKIILIYLDNSYLILIYLEWSELDLNGTGVFFGLVASVILSNRLKNGSLDAEDDNCNCLQGSDRK